MRDKPVGPYTNLAHNGRPDHTVFPDGHGARLSFDSDRGVNARNIHVGTGGYKQTPPHNFDDLFNSALSNPFIWDK